MVLDYSQYETYEGKRGTVYPNTVNNNLFFSQKGQCPFCEMIIKNKPVHKSKEILNSPLFQFNGITWESETVWLCEKCGWWQHEHYMESQGDYDSVKIWDILVHNAILKQYSISDYNIPVEVLIKELLNHKNEISSIHYKKMEEIVQYVFQSHFNCEVVHVGKSYDGGIDLLAINADTPIAIQVKRRQNPDKTEPVSLIRELIGATLLAGLKDCIYVTSSNKFSPEAEKAKKQAIEKNLVETFELYNRESFFGIMNIHSGKISSEWANLLKMK